MHVLRGPLRGRARTGLREGVPDRRDLLRRPRRYGCRSEAADCCGTGHLHPRNLRPRRGRRYQCPASFVGAVRADRLHYRPAEDADARPHASMAARHGSRFRRVIRRVWRADLDRATAHAPPRAWWGATMNWRIRLTWWDKLLLAIMACGAIFALVRFVGGIGSIANINNAYPWGWWVGYGIMTMIAMRAVGFTITALVEILGVHRYHPFLRPAVLMVELGRPWKVWWRRIHYGPMFGLLRSVLPIFGRISEPARNFPGWALRVEDCHAIKKEAVIAMMRRASFHARRRRGYFTFLVLLSLLGTRANWSWGQESVLDQGPSPDSVLYLNSPLDISFLPPIPLPITTLTKLIRDRLKPQLEPLPPFFRDTQLGLNLRLYYFDRENHVTPPKSDNEAFTFGGSLAYQSGWLADSFRVGVEGFLSQRLYGPDSRDGTLLLRPEQKSYTVLGRAYGELKYEDYTATLGRQYLDTPYANQQDNRMTPNTFEAYKITGRLPWVQFAAGYVAQIKPRNTTTFTSMSEQAGAPQGRERGMFAVGARFTPTTDINFGAINYYVPDTDRKSV